MYTDRPPVSAPHAGASFAGRLLLLATVIPPLALLGLILHLGVDFPFFDEWGYMGKLLSILKSHPLGFADFIGFHNDHRIFTTSLTFSLMFSAGTWNRLYFYLLNYLFSLGSFALLAAAWRRSLANLDLRGGESVYLVISLMLFSTMQYESWTWGFQIQWFHNIFFSSACLLALTSPTVAGLFGSMALGIVASLTIAAGLFVWPVGAVVLAAQAFMRRRRVWALLLWLAISAVSWKLYFWGYSPHLGQSPLAMLMEGPLEAGKAFLALVGAPLCNYDNGRAVAHGALGTFLFAGASGMFLAVSKRRDDPLPGWMLFWLSLCAYTLMSLFSIAVSRYKLGGVSYVLGASRYTSLSVLFWSGLAAAVVLPSKRFMPPSLKIAPVKLVAGAALCFVAISFAYTTNHALRAWLYRHSTLEDARRVALQYDPELLAKFSEPAVIIRKIGFINADTLKLLREFRLTPFAGFPSDPAIIDESKAADGHVDSIVSKPSDIDGIETVEIRGRLDGASGKQMPRGVVIARGGAVLGLVGVFSQSPDVEKATGERSLPLSDWRYILPAKTAGDPSTLDIYAVSADGRSLVRVPRSTP